VSPIGFAHHRACELYQCLVGRHRVERIAKEHGLTLTQTVYGVEHANEHHYLGQGFYKFKYLKSYDCETGKMLAYPSGLPGWDPEFFYKIHFVGHSMGAITVRYLQYLLKIGFFDVIEGRTKINRARIVASLTSLSGANNG
jgi:triacylglycerol esterase/lipase EstA (alpha/beta hydrolase family)